MVKNGSFCPADWKKSYEVVKAQVSGEGYLRSTSVTNDTFTMARKWTHQVGSPEDLPETDVPIVLGLSLLLVKDVMDELPFILDVIPWNLAVKPAKQRFTLLIEVSASAVPWGLYDAPKPNQTPLSNETHFEDNKRTREEDVDDQHQRDLTPLRENGDPPRVRMSQIEFPQRYGTDEASQAERE